MPARSSIARWLGLSFLAVAFGVSYAQYPLFYHTQNQYFFHGLARIGFGYLSSDWFARTPDPWPVFTFLVELTYRHLDPRFFYAYFVVLLGVYAFSLTGIGAMLFGLDRSRSRYLLFAVLVMLLHAPLFGYVSRVLLGLPMESSAHHFNVGRIVLWEGIGDKRLLGDMLNPGTFGVLLLLSIYLFLRGRPFLAAVSSSVAALFHPSYVLHAGVLTIAYMAAMVRRRDALWRPLGVGALALAVVLPTLVYLRLISTPLDPALWRQAQDVLLRIAYYPPVIPASSWLGESAVLKAGMVVAAMYLVRRSPLFLIVLALFVAVVGFTAVQILTGNPTLGLLLPWRLSALLTPLASVILLGYTVTAVLDRYQDRLPGRGRILVPVSMAALLVLVVGGVVETWWRFDAMDEMRLPGVMRFVRTARAAGQVYLIPPNWRQFRLFTGAPVFAERSVIPYNDVGVMEWHTRVRKADAFYGTSPLFGADAERLPPRGFLASRPTPPEQTPDEPAPEERCQMLRELVQTYGVTHVVVKKGGLDGCEGWRTVFSDDTYSVYIKGA